MTLYIDQSTGIFLGFLACLFTAVVSNTFWLNLFYKLGTELNTPKKASALIFSYFFS